MLCDHVPMSESPVSRLCVNIDRAGRPSLRLVILPFLTSTLWRYRGRRCRRYPVTGVAGGGGYLCSAIASLCLSCLGRLVAIPRLPLAVLRAYVESTAAMPRPTRIFPAQPVPLLNQVFVPICWSKSVCTVTPPLVHRRAPRRPAAATRWAQLWLHLCPSERTRPGRA